MNHKSYRWILYVITTVIIGTLAIQIYWNYKNYLVNKQQLINDVQQSLDDAVEGYYAGLAQNETIAIAFEAGTTDTLSEKNIDSLLHKFDFSAISTHDHDSLELAANGGLTYIKVVGNDTIIKQGHRLNNSLERKTLNSPRGAIRFDSLTQWSLSTLTSRVMVSLTNDNLKLETIDSLLKKELEEKQIKLSYGLLHDGMEGAQYLNKPIVESASINTKSNSPYLAFNSTLGIYYNNPISTILKRILAGILLSAILFLSVIVCLFYLLKIIKQQKHLAEVKNDLISNITHEFKTPIATIGVALESIRNFNTIEDKDKTKTYLNMSSSQLVKLNTMVEKLLETASLDSNDLQFNKESIDLGELLANIVEKHRVHLEEKNMVFIKTQDKIMASVDVFHFENAINNIIDNAIKYGGDEINIALKSNNNTIDITISDSGNNLTKAQKERVFEKFYRVPKGNTHDVKGFGIGLYYTKKIIENHQGKISLDLHSKTTIFIISLPK